MKQLTVSILRVVVTPIALSLPTIPGCNHPAEAARAAPLTIEVVEVETGSPVRHLFDKNDVAVEIPARSSTRLEGTVIGFVPGWTDSNGHAQPDGLSFKPGAGDEAKFKEWTAARIDKQVAIIVGEQVWIQAQVKGALSGMTQLDVPPKIHAREVQQLVDEAKHWPK